MKADTYGTQARGMFFALIAEFALVSFAVPDFETESVSGSHWRFLMAHPLLVLHVLLGTAIVLGSIPFVADAMRTGKTSRKVLAVVALLGTILAWVMGERFVATYSEAYAQAMSVGWLLAIVAYAAAWWVSRKARA